MACLHIAPDIHVCRVEGTWSKVEGRRRKKWWCFKCRKHLMHTRMMFDPGPESYRDPSFMWECPQCHEEHVLFPGYEWNYED
jgi:hypothetical protein